MNWKQFVLKIAPLVACFSAVPVNAQEDFLKETSKCRSAYMMTVKTHVPDTWVPIIVRDIEGGRVWYDADCQSDGTFEYTDLAGSVMCRYKVPGEYVISLCGDISSLVLVDDFEHLMDVSVRSEAKYHFIEVNQWGDVRWHSMAHFAEYANNIRIYTSDAPDLRYVKSMNYMFAGARLMNENIEHWDVSNVESMDGLFMNTWAFNQPLAGWNTSRVQSMYAMFKNADQFNQPIGAWNVSNVRIFNEMFAGTHQFNQPLNDWNVTEARMMTGMFESAKKFNQSLEQWNPLSLLNNYRMFYGAGAFVQDTTRWRIPNKDDRVVTGIREVLIDWKTEQD